MSEPSATTKTFSIVNSICDSTKQPFGDKYAGTFTVRRPSLLDKKNIAVKDAASMSFAGEIAPGTISDGVVMINYAYYYVTTIAEEKLPEWFNLATMFDPEDEDAVMAVWKEVSAWLATFRPKAAGNDSGTGSDKPPVLVQE